MEKLLRVPSLVMTLCLPICLSTCLAVASAVLLSSCGSRNIDERVLNPGDGDGEGHEGYWPYSVEVSSSLFTGTDRNPWFRIDELSKSVKRDSYRYRDDIGPLHFSIDTKAGTVTAIEAEKQGQVSCVQDNPPKEGVAWQYTGSLEDVRKCSRLDLELKSNFSRILPIKEFDNTIHVQATNYGEWQVVMQPIVSAEGVGGADGTLTEFHHLNSENVVDDKGKEKYLVGFARVEGFVIDLKKIKTWQISTHIYKTLDGKISTETPQVTRSMSGSGDEVIEAYSSIFSVGFPLISGNFLFKKDWSYTGSGDYRRDLEEGNDEVVTPYFYYIVDPSSNGRKGDISYSLRLIRVKKGPVND